MNRRKSLTDIGVAALKPRASRYAFPDSQLAGHFVRVTPTGSKSYCAVSRDPVSGKQVWATIGPCDAMPIATARKQAADALQRIRAGQAAFEPAPIKPDSFRAVSEVFIKRHVVGRGVRTHGEIERILKVYVLPQWADLDFMAIRRSDVVKLLDRVQDENGAAQADKVLTVTRALFNWFAVRNDNYLPPVARGMRRTDHTRRRSRILDDDELRAVWARAEAQGGFGAMVRLLLMTAQRLDKVAGMRWADIAGGIWQVPCEDRQKGTGGALVLPRAALDIIATLPRMAGNDFVFAGRGESYVRNYAKQKQRFDAGLPEMPPWVLHDLRRTARSLMARAGVRPDIAERVMGHVIAGVEGIYDRHSYRDEKADALKRLAALIKTIINPPGANVIPLKGAAR